MPLYTWLKTWHTELFPYLLKSAKATWRRMFAMHIHQALLVRQSIQLSLIWCETLTKTIDFIFFQNLKVDALFSLFSLSLVAPLCKLSCGLIVRVPSLKSRRFFESLAPLVQHRFFYTSMLIRVKEARICLLARKQPRRSWPKKLISEAPLHRRLHYRCDKRAECQSTRSAKASHLNAVREPWTHASRKLRCRIADENRTKVRSMCPSWVFIPPEGPAWWPNFS